jgi:aminopeptidase N
MVAFFSRMIGYTYPWEKYAQVLIHDFIEGGMENTSATALADDITVFDARARVDHSPTSLIAHELAHQWWGDVVTCKDWRHLWLNEGFASYFDPLYHEHAFGRDEFDYSMYRNQQEGIETDKRLGRKPIVSVGSYGANIYARGSAVLHMLRFVLGDQLFWRALHHYIARYQFMPVETHDLQEAIEEATGQNLYWFFDQWLYKAGYPVFHLSYRYSDTTHSVLLSVRQEQKIDSLTGVFRSPVDIDIASHAGTITHHVDILTRDTTFTLPCPAPPQLVIFDKGNWLLKELVWEKSRDEWMYQSESARNPIDRILAVQQLARLSNNESFVPLLSRIARHDRFWAVRREAVTTAGRLMVEDEPLRQQLSAALIAATSDPRPEVRTAAVGQLGNFRGANITDALRASLHDSSYDVVAAALGSLTRTDSAGAAPVLEQYVDVPSYRNILQIVALRSLVRVDSSEGIALALQKTRYGEPQWTRFTALSILDRYAKGREEFKPLLSSLVDDKNRLIQSTAIRMLGEIGNKADLPLLERIASDKENQNAATAEGSIEKILKRKSGDQ